MEARLMKHELKYNKQTMKSLSEPLDDDQVVGACEDAKKKITTLKRGVNRCQADKCSVDLNDAKPYHRRHKVCEHHAKAQAVLLAGIHQRFCQQCSRFQEVSEFDEAKRSCRRRLAGHNERRRKNPNTSSNSKAEGSIQMEGSGAGTTTNGHYQTKNCL